MNKKTKIIIICISAVAVLSAGASVTMFMMLNNQEDKPQTVYTMDEGNYQQIREDMNEQVQEGYFETYMTFEWKFSDGSSDASDAMLGNSPNNTKPIRCELLLDETGEVLFKTGVLPVGTFVSPIRLEKDLDAGIYDTTCMIYLINETADGTYEEYSSAGFHVTLTVEN